MEEVECYTCGKNIERYPYRIEQNEKHYCSDDCKGGKPVDRECDWCGEMFEVKKSRLDRDNGAKYCSKKCLYESQKKERVKIECENCGEMFEEYKYNIERGRGVYCSQKCANEHQVGENAPNWKGGATRYYGENWVEMRNNTRERDDYKCVICGKGEEEIGRMPSVHHIKPIGTFDEPEDANYLDNLVSLCIKHHNMLEKLEADEQKDIFANKGVILYG